MAYQLGVAAAVEFGLGAELTFVTDYRGSGGLYISLSPQYITNYSAGVAFGVQFFPLANMSEFPGWGWGIGISGGPPSKAVGGGVNVAISQNFDKFQGFGFSASLGAGVIPGDIGISASHAWELIKY